MMTTMTRRWLPLLFVLLSALVPAAARAASATATAKLDPPGPLHPGDKATLVVTLDVRPGLHAQSHTPTSTDYIPLTVTPAPSPAATFGPADYPPGKDEVYLELGTLNVYVDRNDFRIPVTVPADAPNGPADLHGTVHLQACNDQSCFPPEDESFSVSLTVVGGSAAAKPVASATEPTTQRGAAAAAVPPPARPHRGKGSDISIPAAFGLAFVAGLLFNVMPCVLPVLPLKAIGFYEVSQHQRGRSFFLGLVFSGGLITVFAVLSLLVVVLKVIAWGDLFAKAWFVWPMAALLLVMGLGLLGAWTTSLPTALYRFEPRHDTVGGNFFWGALTAVLATPCTAPLLPVVLAFAVTEPVYVGVPAMLMVGVGMASPYLLLSATPELARRFPRTGPWPELFKQVMGFLIIAFAVYLAGGRLFAGPEFWWPVVAVVAAAGLFLVARTTQLTKNAGPVAVAAALAIAMFGGSFAWAARINGVFDRPTAAAGTGESWQPYSDARFKQLRADGKPVMLKFTANWCASCQVIEGTVYHDPAVWAAMNKAGMAALKVDLTDANAPGHDLLLTLNPAGGIPVTAVYPPHADEPEVFDTLYTSADFIKAVDRAAAK